MKQRKSNKVVLVAVRMPKELREQLKYRADQEELTLSRFIRRAIRREVQLKPSTVAA